MRFLIDNSMSPRFAARLRDAGHEAVHVRDESLTSAADIVIFGKAESDGSTLVAQDTDFGTILAMRKATRPSVVLFRCHAKSTEALAKLLLANLTQIQGDLETGAVVVIEDTRIRTRRLPLVDGHGRA